MIRIYSFTSLIGLLCIACVYGGETVDSLSLSRGSFNPSIDHEVELTYQVPGPQNITVRVYDPDKGLVRTLLHEEVHKKGQYSVKWNGRDDSGNVVPDEAYTFVVEGSEGLILDPWTYSGGVVEDITNAIFDHRDDTVKYTIPEPARVLIRLGVKDGPMYKTLVDWKPRVAGRITEYWDGLDENRLFDLRQHKDFTALVTYVTLPQATVVVFGNKAESYSHYKREVAVGRETKSQRPWHGPTLFLRPANLVPPLWLEAPVPSMEFPENRDAVGVTERLKVRVDVRDTDRSVLANDQYEIIFYVDDVFFGEAERGHLPFNWVWELHQFPPGKHRLTVNISSAKGMIGVVSRNVDIVRSKSNQSQ